MASAALSASRAAVPRLARGPAHPRIRRAAAAGAVTALALAVTSGRAGVAVRHGAQPLDGSAATTARPAPGAASTTGAFAMTPIARGVQAGNPAQGFALRFARTGVELRSGHGSVYLRVRAAGFGNALAPVSDAAPVAHGNRVSYARGAISEWYRNAAAGLEQGFNVERPPVRASGGPLTIALAVSGDARPLGLGGSAGVALLRPGVPPLHYGGLTATDARGRRLNSWIEVAHRQLLLRVDARGASYPLLIDPFIQEAEALRGSGFGGFGESVAVSGDGATAIVGAPSQDAVEGKEHKEGAVYVFARSHGKWVQQGGALGKNGSLATPASFAGGQFGASVAISANGNVALVGSPDSRAGAGLAWVFTRSGSDWDAGQRLFNSSNVEHQRRFGGQVAISADASTALVSAEGVEGEPAAIIFTRSGSAWSPRQRIEGLRGGLALSSDGGTLLIGATVFARSGSSWTQQGPTLSGSNQVGVTGFGASTALSADGGTALIGGPEDNRCTSCVRATAGAAWAFTRSGSTWTQQGAKLTASGAHVEGHFGEAVALSGNGDVALIGAPGNGRVEPVEPGAVYVFERSGSTFAQRGQFTPAGARWDEELDNGPTEFGTGVAVSESGRTAIAAASDFEEGWASAFADPATVSAISPASGPRAGGTSVAITGSSFAGASGVSFGGTSATSFKVNSDSSITAVAPPGAGTVDVTVTLPDPGESTTDDADEFNYDAVPEFGRCEPTAPKTGQFKGAQCTKLSRRHRGNSEWRRGPGPAPRFTGVLRSPALESIGAARTVIACAGGQAEGTYTRSHRTRITSLTLTGCAESPSQGVGSDCQNAGGANGEIETNELRGALGVISHAKKVPVVGLDLRPASGHVLASFECGGGSTATGIGGGDGAPREIVGSVIGQVRVVDRMSAGNTVTYRTSGGHQLPESFEGGAADVLTTLTGLAQSPEPTTFSALLEIASEEPLEVNTAA
jgi:IPT/TIG domain/FG-GAP repeat